MKTNPKFRINYLSVGQPNTSIHTSNQCPKQEICLIMNKHHEKEPTKRLFLANRSLWMQKCCLVIIAKQGTEND